MTQKMFEAVQRTVSAWRDIPEVEVAAIANTFEFVEDGDLRQVKCSDFQNWFAVSGMTAARLNHGLDESMTVNDFLNENDEVTKRMTNAGGLYVFS